MKTKTEYNPRRGFGPALLKSDMSVLYGRYDTEKMTVAEVKELIWMMVHSYLF